MCAKKSAVPVRAGARIFVAAREPNRHRQYIVGLLELRLKLQLTCGRSAREIRIRIATAPHRAREAQQHFSHFAVAGCHVAVCATLPNTQRQQKSLQFLLNCSFCNFVSRFTRAYDGALAAAQLTRADAASRAGIHPSTLSRIMAEEIDASPDHVERMLAALSDRSDRLHCLREYLLDQTPSDYRDGLAISFGLVEESTPRKHADPLQKALHALENAATEDSDLQRLIIDLAKVVSPPPRRNLQKVESQEEQIAQAELRKAERAQSLRERKQSAAGSNAEQGRG